MKKVLFLALCCIGSGAFAEEVYKCEQDGRVTISTTPCPSGATATVVPVEKLPPASESPEDELARMKQQADALERERLAREAASSSSGAEENMASDEVEEADGDEAGEAPNPQGRLNIARKKRQEAQKEQRRQERREARREAAGGSGGASGGATP